MNYFVAKQAHHRSQYSSVSLFIVLAFLLLAFTNAATPNNQTNELKPGLLTKAKNYVSGLWNNINEKSADNLTATNETVNVTKISFKDATRLHQAQMILSVFLRVLAQLFIIFGGIIPYFPQYAIIKRTQNAEGFSNYVCLTLLVANILRIEFWFGKHFETPLLLQSIVMIICMLIMLELWTRVHAKSLIRRREPSDLQCITISKEQLTEEVVVMKFTDFKVDYFWRWTRFTSYIQFLLLITIILSVITWIFLDNHFYVETIGLLAVLCEALLGIPQFLRNWRLKSTEGMSVQMVLLWTSGDIFKTVYFIFRSAPKQFWLCGILQISIDIAILAQVVIYSRKARFRPQ